MFGFLRKKPKATKADEQPAIPVPPPFVVPLVATLAHIDACRRHVEASHPAGPQRALRMPVTEPLAGDLCIAYTSDLERFASLLSEGEVPTCGVPRDGLLALAVRNLRRHVQRGLTINQGKELFQIAGLNGLEASMLAVPEVWDGLGSQFGGDVVVAVPFAGTVIAYVEPPANAPIDRKAAGRRAKAAFLAECREALRTANANPLSSHAFAWREGGWVSLGPIEPAQPASDSPQATYRCTCCGGDRFVKTGGVFDEESLKCVGCAAVVTQAQVAAAIEAETARHGADAAPVQAVAGDPAG